MSKIDYDKWIKCKSCLLEEAVGVITETPNLNETTNTRTYKKALEAIQQNKLKAEFEFEEPDFDSYYEGVDGATRNLMLDEYRAAVQENNVEKASKILIEPRDFIKWCNENQIHVNPELNRFFNYDYWLIHRKYWNFHEAVMVILSKNTPPFPHEIDNVFEKDDEHFYFATRLKNLIDDWSIQICCYELDNGNPVEIQFSSKIYSINNVYFERKNLLLEIKKEVIFLEDGFKNNKFRIASKIIDDYASDLLEKEEEKEKNIKNILSRVDVKDGEKIYNQLLPKSPKDTDAIILQDCFNLICGIKSYPFGIYAADSHIIDAINSALDLGWLKKRYERRQIYQNLFFKDFELGKINFAIVGDVSDSEERLYAKVLFSDFLSWASKNKINFFNVEETDIEKKKLKSDAPEDRLIEFIGKRKIEGQKYTIIDNANDMAELGLRDSQRFEALIDGMEEDGLINKGNVEVSGKFQRFRLELTIDGWERFDEVCDRNLRLKEIEKTTKDLQESKAMDDEMALELECIEEDLNYSIIKIFDYRSGAKKELFKGKKFKKSSQHGKFIITLCKEIADKECVEIDPSKSGLLTASKRASQMPNELGFNKQFKELKSLFFDDNITNKRVVFYKKITKKRLEEKGLSNKI